jgi:hypothetical protein
MRKISRTTNPTGQRQLDAALFSVRAPLDAEGRRNFWLERFDFAHSGLKPGLKLACIAHAGSTEEYFELGTVDVPDHSTRPLLELATDRPLKFRFLVYEPGNPLLVGFADNVRPLDEAGELGNSLVDIQPADLHGCAWKLDLPSTSAGDDKPVLLVDRELFPTATAAARDPWVAVLVMPEVMRQIAKILVKDPGSLNDENSWTSSWAAFFEAEGISPPADDFDEDGRTRWIDEVIETFCAKPLIKAKFSSVSKELGGDKS